MSSASKERSTSVTGASFYLWLSRTLIDPSQLATSDPRLYTWKRRFRTFGYGVFTLEQLRSEADTNEGKQITPRGRA